MNLRYCNIENLKFSNFVFSLLVSVKPVSGEGMGAVQGMGIFGVGFAIPPLGRRFPSYAYAPAQDRIWQQKIG